MGTISHTNEIEAVQTAHPDDVCYHCGEVCIPGQYAEDDKHFCCAGCQTVYSILARHDMCRYYELEPHAGIRLQGRVKERYEYLDHPEVVEELVDFHEKERAVVRFHLPQIHCVSCIWLLENLHRFHEGINSGQVNFPKRELRLVYDPGVVSLRQLVELLASIGYAPAISLDRSSGKTQPVDRSLIYRLGLAGFCFGNIMLLSFPEYLGLASDAETYYRLFGYLNIGLALPVFLYAGYPYWHSAWQGLRHRTINMDMPITLGMLALFFRSVYEIVSHTGAGYLDSLAGLVFFLLIGRWFQQKTYRSLSFDRDYSSYFPIAATRLEDGREVAVPVKNIQPGDRLFIRYAELIPADGVLINGQGHIDYSFVTGEADIIDKRSGDAVFAGGRHMGEPFEMEVTRKTDQSYLTSLWSNAAFDDDRKEKAQRLADTVGKYFTMAVVAIALGTLAYWWPRDIGIAMQAFAAVLIIACPCAIALSIPFTYGNILRLMARRSFFIKHTGVIESIQGLSRIVFDKTGTLTAAEQSRVSYTGQPLSEADTSALRSLAFQSSHPASRRLQRYLENGQLLAVSDVSEQVGAGVSGTVAGRRWVIGSPAYLSSKGIAPPVSNGRGVCIAVDGAPLGEFTFDNAYRPGLRSVIDRLAGRYRISLLTGDNDRERQWLESSLGNDLHMHFDQRPEDKLHYVKNRQLDGEKVLMIGDGLNDAGALRQADVGIVLTENTNNFTPASDAIIAADRFEDIPQILRFIAGSNRLIYAAYGLALVYNVVGLSYAVTGALSPLIAAILMPLSSVTIVAFGVLSSTWLANRHGLGKNTIDQHQNNT